MKVHGLVLLTVTVIAAASSPAAASRHGWAHASSAGRNLLVVTALGVPAVQGDWRGDLQAADSLVVAGGTTYLLKELVHERRLDGSDNRSFPSGHTSISFAAAATLEKRYGWKAGVRRWRSPASWVWLGSRRTSTMSTTSSQAPPSARWAGCS